MAGATTSKHAPAPASSFSKVDEYGFERAEDFDYGAYEEFMSVYLKVLAKRSKKWSDLLADGTSLKKNYTVKRFVRKGIPGGNRSDVWMVLSGASVKRSQTGRLYDKLLNTPFENDLIGVIKTDLPRTFPDNIYFNKTANHQAHLFNVLAAYAHNNRDVGYCQGLNYIAGLLLLVTNDEEATFWLLKTLVENVLPDYYTRTMDGLITDIEVLSMLVKEKIPDVHRHVDRIGLPWAVICTKWFVCLFAEVLPTETVLRIWDCLFYEGSKILFRVSLTLIKYNRSQILKCDDFSSLAECFKSIMRNSFAINCHVFMQSVFKLPGRISNSQIQKMRETVSKKRLEGDGSTQY